MVLGTDGTLSRARFALRRLSLFRDFGKKDGILPGFGQFLDGILNPEASGEEVLEYHHHLAGKILEHSLQTPFPPVGSPWQDYLLDSLLLLENTFTRQGEQKGWEGLSQAVLRTAQEDLLALQILYNLEVGELEKGIKEFLAAKDSSYLAEYWNLNPWRSGMKEAPLSPPISSYALQLKQSFQSGVAWDKLLEPLVFYYRTVGTGYFSYCYAFRFEGTDQEGLLKTILEPDPIRLSHLVGYEGQRGQIIRNTEQFLQGFSANNLLLYGDRGTGKSSTIKALVHEYGSQGLRMVEMTKQDLGKLPRLLNLIRQRPHRFIIFIDDLSFEEGEVDYKHLKAILEGSLEARPENVLIYATSNRRHLIRERFSDRDWNKDGEVRAQDTLQEKLSLADRFGMTITFTSPDQEQYLEIVAGLAQQRGLAIDSNELRERALKWALWHNGRSGRTARQFIDDLVGRMEAGYNH